tara:strand:- start:3172 stop:3837 length:666 start_codon:yes stop_codon:yes gene_type:complete
MNYTNLSQSYQINISYFEKIIYLALIIQVIISSFHLFLPRTSEISFLSQGQLIIIGLLFILISTLISSKIIDQSADISIYVFRIMCVTGISHQYYMEYDTILIISVYAVSLLIEIIITPKIKILKRTQVFVINDKLTKEVISAMNNGNEFMKNQIYWLSNVLKFSFIVILFTILVFRTLEFLSLFFDSFIDYFQLFGIISLIGIIILILYKGFPKQNDANL